MVALATIGARVASGVISKLLIEYAKDQMKMQLGLKDEVARLENALPKIQAVLNAVDQGLVREENPPLEKWLWQLRDAADQADNVMDEMEYNAVKEKVEQVEKSKVSKAVSSSKFFFQRAIYKDPTLKRLKEAVKAIEEVAADVGEFYEVGKDLVKNQKEMVKSAISGRETSSVSNVGTQVFGRKEEKNDIINKLLNPKCKIEGMNFSVLPIIGQGGVGKTTIAQLVYNDSRVKKHFELRMWVCISTDFNVDSLSKKLYESAFQEKADFDNFDLIHTKLDEKFKSKKFLVVFDDAWNENDTLGWEKLLAPLKSGDSESMILLTTRLETVVRSIGHNPIDPIFLKGLNESDMCNIFQGCAFGGKDPNYHKELVEIGRSIVKKLKGSPLAAKTVGGILCSNLSEVHWKSVLESELWSLKHEQNDIMPALRLTYQYLPLHLKSCFSFCSIFSQDHVFIKNDLIFMWIALDLVPRHINGTKSPEDVGSEYFDDLLNRSIFIPSNQDPLFRYKFHVWHSINEKPPQGYVMHDLMHDLSVFVSEGECFRTNTDMPKPIPYTVRHLNAHVSDLSKSSTSLKNVRTLILHIGNNYDFKLVTEILKGMANLRILTLFFRGHYGCPEIANNLLHLRYLSLNLYMHALPKSISRLYLLETMVIYPRLQENEDHVLGKLINLRHVIASEQSIEKIASIGRLTSLQELCLCLRKENGFKICELRDMSQLRHLSIKNICDVGSCDAAIQANLRNKVRLSKLSLQWSPFFNEPDEDVFDHLEPHSGLKELIITGYEGGRPPTWLRTQTLSKLECLKVHHCNWEDSPRLEELPFLKYVEFRNMRALKGIIHKCNQTSQVGAFPSLEVLSFERMPAIEQWYLTLQPHKWMQCLGELSICYCPKLSAIPPLPVSLKKLKLVAVGLDVLPNLWEDQSNRSGNSPSLVEMNIWDCKNLVSLAEGLLQKPEQFTLFEKLSISNCNELIELPHGGFNKFISLKELDINYCPKIQGRLVQECFLPSALQMLCISSCGDLEVTLPKALESVHSLISLKLYGCENLTSLPPKEVFSRWKTLRELTLIDCPELTSLEGLVGLFSVEYLHIYGCPKLVSTIPSPLSTPSSSMKTEEEPLLSVDVLVIDDPLLLSIEPIRRLSAVRKLIIENCSELQSLPELPPSLEELRLYGCCPELLRRCENSGADSPKLCHIPKLRITSQVWCPY